MVLLALTVPAVAAAGEDPDATRYAVAWDVRESVHEHEAILPAGGERAFRFRIEEPNVTRVRFEVTWQESHENKPTGPDTFTLEASRPDGTPLPASPATSASGRLALESGELVPVPEPLEVTARDAAELEAALAEHASDAAAGAWPLVVRLDDTGAPADDPRADTGNRYTVRVSMWYYAPVAKRVVTLEPAPLLAVGGEDVAARPVWAWATPVLALVVVAQTAFIVARRKRA